MVSLALQYDTPDQSEESPRTHAPHPIKRLPPSWARRPDKARAELEAMLRAEDIEGVKSYVITAVEQNDRYRMRAAAIRYDKIAAIGLSTDNQVKAVLTEAGIKTDVQLGTEQLKSYFCQTAEDEKDQALYQAVFNLVKHGRRSQIPTLVAGIKDLRILRCIQGISGDFYRDSRELLPAIKELASSITHTRYIHDFIDHIITFDEKWVRSPVRSAMVTLAARFKDSRFKAFKKLERAAEDRGDLEGLVLLQLDIQHSREPDDDAKVVEAIDRFAGQVFRDQNCTNEKVEKLLAYYMIGTIEPQESVFYHRLARISLDAGALKWAEQFYEKDRDNQGLLQVGLKYAERKKYDEAFELFRKANLGSIFVTQNSFYNVVGKRAITLLQGGMIADRVRSFINDEIKPDIIRRIDVAPGGWIIKFQYGRYYDLPDTDSGGHQNTVEDIGGGYLPDNVVRKKYKSPERKNAESTLLDFLWGKVPIKQKIGEDEEYIYLERSPGVALYKAKLPTFESTVRGIEPWEQEELELSKLLDITREIAGKLYDVVNQSPPLEELERHGINYRLDRAYIDQRVDTFLSLAEASGKATVQAHREKLVQCLLDHREGLIHNDFSARNVLYENGNLVVIDHEDYREGHPATQIISLWMHPDVLGVMPGTKRFQEWAATQDQDLIKYSTAFWCMRQANGASRNGNSLREAEWYTQKVAEVLP